MDVFKTGIVADEHVALAREVASALGAGPVSGQFSAKLSPTSEPPPTHWCMSGYAPYLMWEGLLDAQVIYDTCAANGIVATMAECQALAGSIDISDENPFSVMTRLGLQMIQPLEAI